MRHRVQVNTYTEGLLRELDLHSPIIRHQAVTTYAGLGQRALATLLGRTDRPIRVETGFVQLCQSAEWARLQATALWSGMHAAGAGHAAKDGSCQLHAFAPHDSRVPASLLGKRSSEAWLLHLGGMPHWCWASPGPEWLERLAVWVQRLTGAHIDMSRGSHLRRYRR